MTNRQMWKSASSRCAKELVNQQLGYFAAAGLNVQYVQMNPLAVYNAMYYDERIKGTTMIVDVGAENTDLIIAEGETIWLRSIPIGGNKFTEALAAQFKLKFPKAEELKRNAATSKYGRQILQAMKPVFNELVSEIQRSIGFYASNHQNSRISRVMVLGGTFRLPGLQKYVQQNLQIEVQRIDRMGAGAPSDAKAGTLFNENILSAVSAYGLALQALGGAKINSSLLPHRIRREKMWRGKDAMVRRRCGGLHRGPPAGLRIDLLGEAPARPQRGDRQLQPACPRRRQSTFQGMGHPGGKRGSTGPDPCSELSIATAGPWRAEHADRRHHQLLARPEPSNYFRR